MTLLRGEQRDDAFAVPHAMLTGRMHRIVIHDDHLLAGRGSACDLIAEPGELLLAQRAVPRMGVSFAPRLQVRQHLCRQSPMRMAFGRREGADLVAVKHDEAPAVAAEAVIGRRHAEACGDFGEMARGDREVVIAEQEERFVPQFLIDRQDVVEAFEAAVDDIAECHDEAQFLAVEELDRLGEFGEAVGVIAVHGRMRRDCRILRVGDDAEAEQGKSGGRHGT